MSCSSASSYRRPKSRRWNGSSNAASTFVFTIGTTSLFPYIARPVLEAARLGKPTVEINPGETFVSRVVSIKLALGAAEACAEIWNRLRD